MQNEPSNQLQPVRTLHLFAGAGGGILADAILGHWPVCAVEIEPFCQHQIQQRQADGLLPWFPIFDDVKTFDGKPWRGLVEIVSGGFPCQDISAAGKGAGIEGERSGLWSEFVRIIREVRPPFVFVENSPLLTRRGIGCVLGDLAALGHDAKWGVLGADDSIFRHGNPAVYYERKRIWILATRTDTPQLGAWELHAGSRREREGTIDTDGHGKDANAIGYGRRSRRDNDTEYDGSIIGSKSKHTGKAANSDETGRIKFGGGKPISEELNPAEHTGYDETQDTPKRRQQKQRAQPIPSAGIGVASEEGSGADGWWAVEPELGRVAHGVADRVDRLAAIGNGQFPPVAALAWRILNH